MLQSAAAADDVAACPLRRTSWVNWCSGSGRRADPLSTQMRRHISLLHNKLGEHRHADGGSCSGSRPRPATRICGCLSNLSWPVPRPMGRPPRWPWHHCFNARNYDPAALFPRLLAALQHLSLAAPVLDLSNYLVRTHRVNRHPSHDRLDRTRRAVGKHRATIVETGGVARRRG